MSDDTKAASSAYLTVEMIDAAFAEIRDKAHHPCGSRERPHVANPARPDFCVECGWSAPSDSSGGTP